MNLSVVVPVFNHLAEVMMCLNTLHAYAITQTEFLVQDDASSEYDARSVIPPSLASVGRNERNLGFAGNCNRGAARASGEILVFLNQDVFAVPGWSPGWDQAILDAFDDPKVGIVGARLLFPDGKVQSVGGLFDARGTPFHRCLGWANLDHPELAARQEVSWTTGAALAIRRELFERVGGFDTSYIRAYWEDVDLCLKVREMGCKIVCEPNCTLIHQTGTTGGNPEYFTHNALLFKERWVDSGKVKPDVPVIREKFW